MSAQKAFASTGDMTEKKISFTEVGPDLFAFTAQGDPNTGVIVGDDCCAVARGVGVAGHVHLGVEALAQADVGGPTRASPGDVVAGEAQAAVEQTIAMAASVLTVSATSVGTERLGSTRS